MAKENGKVEKPVPTKKNGVKVPKRMACKDCGKKKNIKKFTPSTHAKIGYTRVCLECWSARMSQQRRKTVSTRKANGEPVHGNLSLQKKVKEANQVLQKVNGTPGSQRSPMRKLMKEIHQLASEQGTEIESITFVGNECRVAYKKVETFTV